MMIDTQGLPTEAVEIYEELLEEQLMPIEELLERVFAFREHIMGDIAESGEFVDEELVESLAARSIELLERVANDYDVEHHRHAQATVRYLIEDEDDENDLGSVVGFDDDMEVFNAVVQMLGHQDLAIGY